MDCFGFMMHGYQFLRLFMTRTHTPVPNRAYSWQSLILGHIYRMHYRCLPIHVYTGLHQWRCLWTRVNISKSTPQRDSNPQRPRQHRLAKNSWSAYRYTTSPCHQIYGDGDILRLYITGILRCFCQQGELAQSQYAYIAVTEKRFCVRCCWSISV